MEGERWSGGGGERGEIERERERERDREREREREKKKKKKESERETEAADSYLTTHLLPCPPTDTSTGQTGLTALHESSRHQWTARTPSS